MFSEDALVTLSKNKVLIQKSINSLEALLDRIAELGFIGLEKGIFSEIKTISLNLDNLGLNNPAKLLRKLNNSLQQENWINAHHELMNLTNWLSLFNQQFSLLTISADMVEQTVQTETKAALTLTAEIDLLVIPLTAFILKTVKSIRYTEQVVVLWIGWADYLADLKPFGFVTYQDQITVRKIENFVLDFENSVESSFYNARLPNYVQKSNTLQSFNHIAFENSEKSLKHTKKCYKITSVLNTTIETLDTIKTENYEKLIQAHHGIKRIKIQPTDQWKWTPDSPILTITLNNISKFQIVTTSELLAKQIILQLLSNLPVELLIIKCKFLHELIPEAKQICVESVFVILGIFQTGLLKIPSLIPIIYRLNGSLIFENQIKEFDKSLDSIKACYHLFLLIQTYQKNPLLYDISKHQKKIKTAINEKLNQFTNKLQLEPKEFCQLLFTAHYSDCLKTKEQYQVFANYIRTIPKKRIKRKNWIEWIFALNLVHYIYKQVMMLPEIETIQQSPFLTYYKPRKGSLDYLLVSRLTSLKPNQSSYYYDVSKYLTKMKNVVSKKINDFSTVDRYVDLISVQLFFQRKLLNSPILEQILKINLLWNLYVKSNLEDLECFYFLFIFT
jgi:hypothetical protein